MEDGTERSVYGRRVSVLNPKCTIQNGCNGEYCLLGPSVSVLNGTSVLHQRCSLEMRASSCPVQTTATCACGRLVRLRNSVLSIPGNAPRWSIVTASRNDGNSTKTWGKSLGKRCSVSRVNFFFHYSSQHSSCAKTSAQSCTAQTHHVGSAARQGGTSSQAYTGRRGQAEGRAQKGGYRGAKLVKFIRSVCTCGCTSHLPCLILSRG